MVDARKYLEQLRKYDGKVRRKQDELDNWKSMAVSMGISYEERVQTSPSDKLSAIVSNIVDAENELGYSLKVYAEMRKRIINAIEQLDSTTESVIIYKHYVEFKPLKMVAIEIHKSYDYTRHVHINALKNMDFIINNTK